MNTPALFTSVMRHLPYRCQAVFDTALTSPPTDRHGERSILELRPVWGVRGEVGSQTIIRRPSGSFDLEMMETIVAIDPPLHFAADEKPLRFVPYNPHERVPPLDVDDRPPQKVFDQTFGPNPGIQRLSFDMAPIQGGCDLTIGLAAFWDVGWFGRRRWTRHATRALHQALDDIERALNTLSDPKA